MTEAKMRIEFLSGCYNTLPNKALGAIMMRNMKEIGAPRWSQEELKFAEDLLKSITYQDRRDSILNSFMPKKEEKLEKLLDDTICDPEDENQISAASTDVGDVSWIVPTASLLTATTPPGVQFHSWQTTACSGMSIGHKGMLLAAKTLALTGIDLITKPEELEKVREEFAAKTKAFVYESPIPREQKPSLDWRSLECNHK
jgi:aminobenzoyl-glutamate utilization protein B